MDFNRHGSADNQKPQNFFIARVSTYWYCVLLNVGTWPIMAWHTVDGLFIGTTALWLFFCQPSSKLVHLHWVIAWLLAGCAPRTKQGCAIVPILIVLSVSILGPRNSLRYAPLIALPPFLYGIWVGPDAIRQLCAGWSGELFGPIRFFLSLAIQPSGVTTITCVVLATYWSSPQKVDQCFGSFHQHFCWCFRRLRVVTNRASLSPVPGRTSRC